MPNGSDARIGLSEFIVELAAELSRARPPLDKDSLTYDVDQVTLELDVAFTLTRSAQAPNNVKPEFWVLGREPRDQEAGLPSARWNTQHVTLRLTPRLEDVQAGQSGNAATIPSLPRERPALSNS